jgi:hypothetical protein
VSRKLVDGVNELCKCAITTKVYSTGYSCLCLRPRSERDTDDLPWNLKSVSHESRHLKLQVTLCPAEH